MSCLNFKVYADWGPYTQRLKRFLAILDTSAEPNVIRRSELPEGVEDHLRYGPLPQVCDANCKPLFALSTVKMPIRLCRFLALLAFVVCEHLAAAAILDTDYCDRFVEYIRQRTKCVELYCGSTAPVVRRPLKSATNGPPLPQSWEPAEGGGHESPTVKAAESTVIPPHTQAWVTVTAKRRGLVIIQPHTRLYANHLLSFTNGVAAIEPERPFRILVANCSDFPKRVVRNQSVPTVLPHPRFVFPTHVSIAEVLGIVSDGDNGVTPEVFTIECSTRSDSCVGWKTPCAADLVLEHVPFAYHDSLRKMLSQCDEMWDGRLGRSTW